MSSSEVKFEFDPETQKSKNVLLYQTYPTNSMVEEFMLLANCAVAQRI
jgi:exoribonuclease R